MVASQQHASEQHQVSSAQQTATGGALRDHGSKLPVHALLLQPKRYSNWHDGLLTIESSCRRRITCSLSLLVIARRCFSNWAIWMVWVCCCSCDTCRYTSSPAPTTTCVNGAWSAPADNCRQGKLLRLAPGACPADFFNKSPAAMHARHCGILLNGGIVGTAKLLLL